MKKIGILIESVGVETANKNQFIKLTDTPSVYFKGIEHLVDHFENDFINKIGYTLSKITSLIVDVSDDEPLNHTLYSIEEKDKFDIVLSPADFEGIITKTNFMVVINNSMDRFISFMNLAAKFDFPLKNYWTGNSMYYGLTNGYAQCISSPVCKPVSLTIFEQLLEHFVYVSPIEVENFSFKARDRHKFVNSKSSIKLPEIFFKMLDNTDTVYFGIKDKYFHCSTKSWDTVITDPSQIKFKSYEVHRKKEVSRSTTRKGVKVSGSSKQNAASNGFTGDPKSQGRSQITIRHRKIEGSARC